jgi:DNA repair protein RadD
MSIPGIVLRSYQSRASARAVEAHRRGCNPVLSLPTGSGKALVAAAIARALVAEGAARIIITVPSRELAEQNERALLAFFDPDDLGVVCAALGRREFHARIIVGTPQSLAGQVRFDPTCVIVDEAHQMPLHRGSWFAKLFDQLPRGKATPRIGLSGTTFRTADGAIYGGRAAWFDVEAFAISVQGLVDQGYLAPIRYVSPAVRMTTKGVSRSAGDYNEAQLVAANLHQVEPQIALFMDEMATRRRGMIFAINVDHAKAYRDALRRAGEDPALIIGAMHPGERRDEIAAFKSGAKRVAITVSAGLTGLDVPEIDLLGSCRPTMSAIVHSQSIGRGARPAVGKDNCLTLDFAGNVSSFGPVHAPHFDKSGQPLGGVAPWRPCRICGTYQHYEAITCEECDAVLPPRKVVTAHDLEFGTIQWTAETAALRALVAERGFERLPVESLAVHAYRKRHDPTAISLMVSFSLGNGAIVRQWFKRLRSGQWTETWRNLYGGTPTPTTIADALNRRHELVRPSSVDIEQDGAFWRVLGIDHGEPDEGVLHGVPASFTDHVSYSVVGA